MSRMGYDAIGLGNNEFDDGPKELAPFVREMRKSGVTVLGTNLDASREPHFKGVPLPRSHVLTISGVKVALLAVVPQTTEAFSKPGRIRILPVADSINRETWRLRQQGVKIFILISHGGFEADKRLAVACPEIDVIVGGHSETFLYTGAPPLQEDARRVRGPYPFIVPRQGRRSCIIVQAYRYGKYLGNLEVLFNRKGEVTHWRGRPILLDQSIGQDPQILRGLMPFKRVVDDALKKVVGSTKVLLEASHKVCRTRECNLGNLITDSFFDYYANKKSKVPHAWSEVNAAVINGGTVRESIRQSSKVTLQDLQRAMPIDNELVLMNMNGSQLHKMFDHAVSNITLGPSHNGKFLQVSGIRVTYDLSRRSGWRVARLRILCANCSVPRYEDVDFQKRYTIVTTSFIANGGDGFKFDKGVLKRAEGASAFHVFTKYFTKLSPIKTAEEGRIVVKNLPPKQKPLPPGQPPTQGVAPGQTPVPNSVPGQTPVPSSVPGQPPIPGFSPGQAPATGPAPSQFVPGQPSSTGPAVGPSVAAQGPNAGPAISQFGPGQSMTGPSLEPSAPGQPPSNGLGSSQFGPGQPTSTQPSLGSSGPVQAQNGEFVQSQFSPGSNAGPALGPSGPGQSPGIGLSPSQFGPGQPTSTRPELGPTGPVQAPSPGLRPSQFAPGSSIVPPLGPSGPGQTPSTGLGQNQFGPSQPTNTGPALGPSGPIQAPSPNQFGTGPSTMPALSPPGPVQAQSTGLGASQFTPGQPSSTGLVPGQFGSLQASNTGFGTGQFSQGQATNTGPAPGQLAPVQTPIPGPSGPYGPVQAQSTGSASGPFTQVLAPSTGPTAGQMGQGPTSSTVPGTSQIVPSQAPITVPAQNPYGSVQASSSGLPPNQFAPSQAQIPGSTQGQVPTPGFLPSQPQNTGFGQPQAPTAAFPTDSTGSGSWSSA